MTRKGNDSILKWTVYIVDDEPMAVRYLETLLKGTALELEVIGTASNGVKAIPEIARLHPDFVFADISMPVMDGLKMSEEILKNDPAQKIFLLTAYRDFEYAKKSISIGVADYILKNELSEEKLEELLGKHTEELIEDQKKHHTVKENNIRRFLLTDDENSENEWAYQDRPMQRYVLMYIAEKPEIVLRHREDGPERYVDCFGIENGVQESGIICRAFVQMFRNEYCGIFFVQQDEADVAGKCRRIAEKILDCAWKDMPEYVCLISAPAGRFSMLQQNYGRLRKKLEYLYMEKKRIYTEEELDSRGNGDRKINADDWHAKWRMQIYAGNSLEAETLLKEYLSEIKSLGIWEYTESIQEILRHLTYEIKEKKLDPKILKMADAYRDTETLEADLLKAQQNYFDTVKLKIEKNFSRHIVTAMGFIREHFAEDISVADIAEAAGISEGHLRRCFKKEMDVNVVTYLMDYRLDRAKQLMNEGREHLDEIWRKTGFTSGQYFSYVFKKKEGVTPSDYMRKGKHEA